jgi:hypothetical protein
MSTLYLSLKAMLEKLKRELQFRTATLFLVLEMAEFAFFYVGYSQHCHNCYKSFSIYEN